MMHDWHTSLIVQFTGVLMATIGLSYGQSVTATGPPAVEQGTNTIYTCTLTGGSSSPTIIWRDLSVNPNVIMFIGENPEEDFPKYANFDASVNGATSTMTITNTVIEDEGVYRCTVGSDGDEQSLAVEVRYTLSLSIESTVENNIDMYKATCEALSGRPEVNITWMLGDSGSPCDSIDETHLTAPTDLFSKRSVCTFHATSENYGETLRCIISGHQVDGLNGEQAFTLNIHRAPRTGIMSVRFQPQDSNLRVSCDIDAADQSNPPIMNYYIYRNDTFVIHQSTLGVNFVDVARPNFATDFRCKAGNYLGNTTSPVATYDPSKAPRTGIMSVRFQPQDSNLRASCDIAFADQPNPSITNYYIFSNCTLIHQSDTGVNSADVARPNFVTDFLCVAGNYLGNTTSPVATYDPSRPK